MKFDSLPASWTPSEPLEIRANISLPLDPFVARLGGEVYLDDRDEYPYHAAFYMADGEHPVMLLEYLGEGQGFLYLYTRKGDGRSRDIVAALMSEAGVGAEHLVWLA